MYEKILQKLKTQRGTNSQVSDKTLEIKAKTLESVIIDEDVLAKIDFTAEIESMQGNIGHVAKQVKEDTEKKAKVEKTPEQIENERVAAEKLANENKDKGISPELAALIKQNEEIMKTLSGIQGEKITTTRSESLNAVLKDAPPYYKDQILSSFKNMNFATDEDFNNYTELTKTNFTQFQQQAKESGLNTYSPTSDPKKPVDDGRTPELSMAQDILDAAEKNNKK